MKRKVEHPLPSERSASGPRYWRSLDELAQTPGFKEALSREFPEGASGTDGVDRRQFMKIMAASFALGGIGLAGCRRPEEYVLPFGKSVEGAVPGLPVYYSTAMPIRNWAVPLLAETHQGRPTKLEGNPSYAPHGGSSSMLAQASILDLYDPDRATAHTREGSPITAAEVKKYLGGVARKHGAARGAGLAFLADSSSSPTRARLVRSLRTRFPNAFWAEYEPVTDEPPAAVARALFGANVKPVYRFAKAKRVLSLDCDFLQAEAGSLYYAREFAKGRRVEKKDDPMSRLYMAESVLSITGTMADHRLRLPSSHMAAFAAALAAIITGEKEFAAAAALDVDRKWIEECAADLLARRGESLVVVGSHLPPSVHAMAHAMNQALGAFGSTVDFIFNIAPQNAGIGALAAAIEKGGITTLIILGGNPVYNAPAELNWGDVQRKVKEVIRYGYYVDETSAAAQVHIGAAHYLESWGDARAFDGTISPVQPMIMPLFGGLTQNEVLAAILGLQSTDPYKLVYDTITIGAGPRGDEVFRRFLHDGVLHGTAFKSVNVRMNAGAVFQFLGGKGAPEKPSRDSVEVRFIADLKVDDGRFVNNGWLQECPDPITKISWDNAVLVSPRLAKELGIDSPGIGVLPVARKDLADFKKGIESAHVVELTLGGRKLRGPAHIQPGLDNYTVVVALGYGRTKTGRIGEGSGFSAYNARTAGAPYVATGATIIVTGERQTIADSQWHWSMEGRDLVREGNLGEYRENPAFAKEIGMEAEEPPVVLGPNAAEMTPAERATLIPRENSLYVTPKFKGRQQWGMSIDLNTCIGCNACVIACQSENNVPIVGRDQVIRGRIMHWIRLDRYYSDGKAAPAAFGGAGNMEIPEEPQISMQPVACMQCELAPCEMVCPVNATVHDDEGLNVMAYNRCIGTRYCANNCPYKVRRFNFFDWNMRSLDSLYMGPLGPEGMPELVQMAKNPEVTIRMRGVMEKCTFCVQRIERGEIEWKVKAAQEGRPEDVIVPDGTIRTACQQACPVEAIVFGDIMDPESAVSRAKARDQDYALLGYLNTRPRTTYLARIRNPNPKMPDYSALPLSRLENLNKNHPKKA